MNDDAFASLGDRAILLDGAGNAQGAAKGCIDFLIAQHSETMPEAILQAQRGSWDDVTLVCGVIS